MAALEIDSPCSHRQLTVQCRSSMSLFYFVHPFFAPLFATTGGCFCDQIIRDTAANTIIRRSSSCKSFSSAFILTPPASRLVLTSGISVATVRFPSTSWQFLASSSIALTQKCKRDAKKSFGVNSFWINYLCFY